MTLEGIPEGRNAKRRQRMTRAWLAVLRRPGQISARSRKLAANRPPTSEEDESREVDV